MELEELEEFPHPASVNTTKVAVKIPIKIVVNFFEILTDIIFSLKININKCYLSLLSVHLAIKRPPS